jgi:hypothetical protein
MGSTLIKNLNTNITQPQIIAKAIFGETPPTIYSTTAIYNINDKAIVMLSGIWVIKVCTADATTGVYNPAKWTDYIPLSTSIDCGSF